MSAATSAGDGVRREEPSPSPSGRAADTQLPPTTGLPQAARLTRLLGRLTRVEREVLHLRLALGCSVDEAAHLLGISPDCVRVSQHQALNRLRGAVRETVHDTAGEWPPVHPSDDRG